MEAQPDSSGATILISQAEMAELLRPRRERMPEILPLSATQRFVGCIRDTLRKLARRDAAAPSKNQVSRTSTSEERTPARRRVQLPPAHERGELVRGDQARVQPAQWPRKYLISVGKDKTAPIQVTIRATLDFLDGQQFMEDLQAMPSKEGRQWILSATELAFCDSATLGFFLMAQVYIRRMDGRFTVKVTKDSLVHRIMMQCRIDKYLTVEFG